VGNTLIVLMSGTAEGCGANGATPNVLEALKRLASEKGFVAVVMPVRPAYKSEYPLISFSQYVHWGGPMAAISILYCAAIVTGAVRLLASCPGPWS
jgi:hypothetical protein